MLKRLSGWLKENYLTILVPCICLLIWESGSRVGVIRNVILPAPVEILNEFIRLFSNGDLLRNLVVSIIRVTEGFAIGVTLGVLIGTKVALSICLQKSVRLIFGVLRPIPVIAWIPLLILWLGIDESSKVVVISIGSFWSVFVSVVQAVRHVDQRYIEVAKVLGKSRHIILFKVILPAALPEIFTGIRIGIDVAWRSVVAAEMIAASAGVGYMIMYARELSQIDVVLVGMLSIGLTGIAIEELVKMIEHHFLKWNANIYKKDTGAKVW